MPRVKSLLAVPKKISYKGLTILQSGKWNMKKKRYVNSFRVQYGGPRSSYKTLPEMKAAIDRWEARQYKKDKRKF